MKARLLGTAAGGGLPQWNCGCGSCTRARDSGRTRTQDCLAVTGNGCDWYLVNASPDLRTQILATPELTPPAGTRRTPVRGVLFTSAELDHTLGLLTLREAERLEVYSTAAVREAFALSSVLAAYAGVDWRTITPGEPLDLAGGLVVTAYALGTKRPRYVVDKRDPDDRVWTVAYRFEDVRTGGVLVYAPGLGQWSEVFVAAMDGAGTVILDGTFATEDEMPGRSARAMGHLPIVDTMPLLSARPGPEYLYTHLNNTNPYAHDRDLSTPRIRVAAEGELLEL